ncbi:hypothetical protein BDQ17DRAFT_1397775 [Cyathus striatus]|nr:hypothetical protein BDQ17DRAFT_1397775 [Cyathus striatus]
MSSAIATSLLGALQASFSVLLTLSFGVFAAHVGMIDGSTASNISSLCRNLFLPALLITNIGEQLTSQNVTNYLPIFAWSVFYALVSVAIGKAGVKWFGLPQWTIVAVTFNNTTSLPLLLTQSLTTTGILKSITGGGAMDEAVKRARGYFLINSLVSNTATFAFGPKLLGAGSSKGKDEREESSREEPQQNGSSNEEPSEQTSLLPKPVMSHIYATENTLIFQFHRLPIRVQSTLKYIFSLLNPTLWGAVLAIFIGLVPPLHKAFFADTLNGGYLNAWLTESLRNIGDLFTALQMYVCRWFKPFRLSQTSAICPFPKPGKAGLAFVFFIRFMFWTLVSIPFIYLLAAKTSILSNDPMLWFSMMLMPVGPPAMILSTLVEVSADKGKDTNENEEDGDSNGNGRMQNEKMVVARILTYMYIITPVMFLAVVAALRTTEMLIDIKGV